MVTAMRERKPEMSCLHHPQAYFEVLLKIGKKRKAAKSALKTVEAHRRNDGEQVGLQMKFRNIVEILHAKGQPVHAMPMKLLKRTPLMLL